MLEEDVNRNYDAIMDKGGKTFFSRTLTSKCLELVNSPERTVKKHRKLIAILEEVSSRIQPHTPCKSGCHHCCHMAVSLSEFEAIAIERFTGRKRETNIRAIPLAADVEEAKIAQAVEVDLWKGKTCPFLKDNKCSIYEVRPIACKTNFNLSNDPGLCDLTKGSHDVPNLNLRIVFAAQAAIYARSRFADIRDFFPD